MLNFRQFDAGPDPFGRKYHVLLKWLQTAISIRHSDTVDVKFILQGEDGSQSQKTMALPHAALLAASRDLKRAVDDPWCARIASMHLAHLIETGEDMDKDLVTLSQAEIRRYGGVEMDAEHAAISQK